MKKLLIAFAAVLVTAATSYGQGLILFNSSVSQANPPVNAPVFMPDGTSSPGPSFSAGLYLVSGANASLIESSITTFRTGSAVAQRHIVGVGVTVDGVPGGSEATFEWRAWETAAGSWDASLIRGESERFSVVLATAPAAPADPIGMEGFTMYLVPEPSTLTLGVLGAAALLLRRHK